MSSLLRLTAGLFAMALCLAVFGTALLFLLPFRVTRIRFCHATGKAVSPLFIALLGCDAVVFGREHVAGGQPVIYVSNHTSLLDIFLAAAVAPHYIVGVAKKQILYYPFFGQLYALSGHLLIDRARTEAAKQSLRDLATWVRATRLSIFMWPEGSRSRDGRLRPFKSGFVHLAIQTGLPVVPFVVHDAHKCWEKSTLRVKKTRVRVDILPPIDTSSWSVDRIDEAVAEVTRAFRETLSADQLAESAASSG